MNTGRFFVFAGRKSILNLRGTIYEVRPDVSRLFFVEPSIQSIIVASAVLRPTPRTRILILVPVLVVTVVFVALTAARIGVA